MSASDNLRQVLPDLFKHGHLAGPAKVRVTPGDVGIDDIIAKTGANAVAPFAKLCPPPLEPVARMAEPVGRHPQQCVEFRIGRGNDDAARLHFSENGAFQLCQLRRVDMFNRLDQHGAVETRKRRMCLGHGPVAQLDPGRAGRYDGQSVAQARKGRCADIDPHQPCYGRRVGKAHEQITIPAPQIKHTARP